MEVPFGAVTYFNKRHFGEDKVVKHPFCDYPWYVQGLQRPKLSYEEAVKQTPLSEKGKKQLLRGRIQLTSATNELFSLSH